MGKDGMGRDYSELPGVQDGTLTAIQGCRGSMLIPWAVLFIPQWIQGGLHMEQVLARSVGPYVYKIWSDAKASDEWAWIGVWLDAGDGLRGAEWFSLEVDEVLAPWCRKGNPKRVIAALEMLATIVAMKLWCCDAGGEIQVMTEAFTDNKGNEFILKKGMSTKFPLTLLVMELSEMMKVRDLSATLRWVKREDNQEADDLTNEEFEKFQPEKRRHVKSCNIHWLVLDKLMKESSSLYEEINLKKQEKRSSKKDGIRGAKKKGKFFHRWTS